MTVGPEQYRTDLVGAAEQAWHAFEDAVGEVPVEFEPPVRFDWSGRTASGVAECILFADPQHPRRDSALIVLSVTFFDKPTSERNLTLLHECIHLRFSSGLLRARVIESQHLGTVHQLPNVNDADEYSFRFRSLRLAWFFRNFVDEILVERYLKAQYPTYVGARSAYYLTMRRASFNRWKEPDVTATLKPYVILHEILRNDLGVQLAEGHPESAEFVTMSAALESELRGIRSEREFGVHMETRRRLMAVAPEPLVFDESAYDQTFKAILSLVR